MSPIGMFFFGRNSLIYEQEEFLYEIVYLELEHTDDSHT
jgi:hypothetical protein